MECKFAYMKQDIPYVLCKKEPAPDRRDRAALFHAVCAHQVECPKQNCHKLSSLWKNCIKLKEAPETAYEDVFAEPIPEPDEELKPAKRSRRKAKAEE